METQHALAPRRQYLILIAATAGAILIPLNTSMLAVALAPIVAAFGVTNAAGAWLVLLYLAVITSLQPAAGKLGDRFGHRYIFIGGLLLFAGASVLAALAPSYGLLILARALQGLAGAALAPNAAALIRLTFPPHRQGHAMGLYVSAFSVGLTAGPVIGGLLVSLWGWPAVFWINLPTVALSCWIGMTVLPASPPVQRISFDWLGTGLFSALVITIVLGANLWKEGTLPVSPWLVIGLLLALGLLFARVEERALDPLLKLSLFRLPGFGAASGAIFFLHMMMYTIILAVPLYLQQGRGMAPAAAGVLMSSYALMQVLVAPFAGRLSDKFGRRLMVGAGGLLYLSGAGMLLLLTPASPLWLLLVALLATGVGTGLTSPASQAAALAVCPPDQVGVGAGVWYGARYLGNIGGALMTGLLLPDGATRAGALYGTMMIVAVLLAGTAGFLPGRERAPGREAA